MAIQPARNLQQIIPALFTGQGGQMMTPEQIQRQQQMAAALMQGASDTSPISHWSQGATRLVDAFNGVRRERGANASAQRGAEYNQSLLRGLLGGMGGGSPSPVSAGGGAGLGMAALPASSGGPSAPMAIPKGEMAGYVREGLIQRGLPPHVADAFVVNFQDESGLNPGINEANPIVAGSRGGYGLYQLTGPRRREYEAFAANRGVNVADPDAQMDFLMGELQGSEAKAGQRILAAPDTATAAQAILNDFLRPAPEHRASRGRRYAGLRTSEPVQVASLDQSIGMLSGPSPEVMAALTGQPQQPELPAAQPYKQQPYVAPQVQVAQAAPQGINPALLEALTSPYADDSTRQIGQMLFGQQQQQQLAAQQAAAQQQALQEQRAYERWSLGDQRAYDASLVADDRRYTRGNQLEDRRYDRDITLQDRSYTEGREDQRYAVDDAYRQQALVPSDIREYEYYRDQELAAGRQPMGVFEYQQAGRRAGAVNVDARNMGTIPQGYRMIYDEAGNPVQMEPIPGGPADNSQSAAAAAESRETSTDIITNAASRAREALQNSTLPVTGTAGRILSNFPESGASEVRRQVGVLQANAKIENLQAMRNASPTGGALGAVSDSESAMLAAKSGALDPDSPSFERDLDDYERTLLRIVHGPKVGDAIFEQSRPSVALDEVVVPSDVDPELWEMLTPEERELWK